MSHWRGSIKKLVERPLPTMHRIEALKNAMVVASSLIGSAAHERDGSTQLSQSQRNQRARPMRFRSSTPKLSRSYRHATLQQATTHLPPCTTSEPDHRKAMEILTKAFGSQGGREMLIAI
jgi:hypothetical protein